MALSISPLESVPPENFAHVFGVVPNTYGIDPTSFPYGGAQDPLGMPNMNLGVDMNTDMGMQWPSSGPSSAFSGSPSPSESSLPVSSMGPESVHAPQPQSLEAPAFDQWTQQTPEVDAQGLPLMNMQPHDAGALHMGMTASEPSFSDYTQSQDNVFSEYTDIHDIANAYAFAEGITGY